MQPATDRRQTPRVPFVTSATVQAAGRELSCMTVDLSATGMLLVPPASARAGLQVRLCFDIPRTDQSLSLEGTLVREGWARGMYAWGVRFCNTPTNAELVLHRYVAKRLSSADHAGKLHQSTAAQRPTTAQQPPTVPETHTSSGSYRRAFSSASNAGSSSGNPVAEQARTQSSNSGSVSRSGSSSGSDSGSGPYRRSFTVAPPPPRPPTMDGVSASHGTPIRPKRTERYGQVARSPNTVETPTPRPRRTHTGSSTDPQVGNRSRRSSRGAGSTRPRPKEEWNQGSGRTPLEVRELYRAALDEVDHDHRRGKKSRPK